MACDRNCNECFVTGGNYIITNFSPPQPVRPGTLVTLIFKAKIDCTACLNNTFIVCLYSNGQCIASTGPLNFTGWETEKDVGLNYIQPEADFYGNLSLIEVDAFGSPICDYTLPFSVKTIVPPGQGYSCNSNTRTCFPDPQSTKTYAQCMVECSGSTGARCSPDEMSILGVCLPKNIIFIGAALGAIYFITR